MNVGSSLQVGLQGARNAARNLLFPATAPQAELADVVDAGKEKEWTVLVYMEGRDHLARSTMSALNKLEEVGSSAAVNVVVQATLEPTLAERIHPQMAGFNTRRYYVKQDQDTLVTSPVVQQMDSQLPLNKETFADFVAWGMKNFPSKHTLVVIKKHGLSYAKNASTVPLSARDMREAFEQAEQATGKKPDVISFDSCLMQGVEVAYELRDRAPVVAGSPEVVRAADFPYDDVVRSLAKYGPQHTAQTVGGLIVETHKQAAPYTIHTAVDTARLTQTAPALHTLIDAVRTEKMDPAEIYSAMLEAASVESRESLGLAYNFRDLIGFARKLEARATSPKVKEAALALANTVQNAELNHYIHPRKRNVTDSNGPTIFLPWKDPGAQGRANYGQLEFARDSGWNDLMSYVFSGDGKVVKAPAAAPSEAGGLAKWALWNYKKYVSPYLGVACPYTPSCSQYAREAVQEHGLLTGTKYAFMRFISCNGMGAGGDDAVPHHHEHGEHDPVHAVEDPKSSEVTVAAPPSVEKSNLRQRVEGTVFRAARLAGKAAGMAAGAVAGLAGGLAMGAFLGWKGGSGQLESFSQGLTEKYGEHKAESFLKLTGPATAPGVFFHGKLGKVVGGLLGVTAGAVLGAVAGAGITAKWGGMVCGLIAQNRAKEACGELPVNMLNEAILHRDYAAQLA